MDLMRKIVAVLLLAGLMAGAYILLQRAGGGEVPVVEYADFAARAGDPPVFYVKTREKVLGLTFDISWGTKTLPLILPILKNYDQKATFFLSGPWAERHPDLARQIAADGHEIASHGEKHVNLSQYPKEEIIRNIRTAHDALKGVTGHEARFFRPPNGDYDDLVVSTARELGYETVIWAVDSLDWRNPGVAYMIDRVTREAFPGAIILFHASDSSRQTHQALPTVLENLRQNGYRLVTLGELFQLGEPGRVDPRGRSRPPE